MAYTTIDNPELYFQVVTYTGSGSSHAITLGGSVDLSPDLVIIKGRAATSTTSFFDTVRGATKQLATSRIGANAEGTVAETLKSFDSDGFTVGTDGDVNYSGDGYVAWCFLESATAGFDIVSYTGNGSARTISHSLSAVPNFMIVKNRGASSDWRVYTENGGNTKWLQLNDTSVFQTASTIWNDTSPTSSVFSVGTSAGVNTDTVAYIAYLFSAKQGFSKFGSYTGNNDADGAFVWTGFRPAFVMNKQTDGTEGWMIHDSGRDPINPLGNHFTAQGTGGDTDRVSVDFLSNGFKWRVANTDTNNGDYIYMAFAEAPFVNSNGVPCNAR